MTVVDRNGDVVELDDDQEIPDGAALRVPVGFMDGGEFHLDAGDIETLRRRCAADDADDDDEKGDDDSDDHDDSDDSDDSDEISPAARSYLNAKMNLDYRTRRKKVPTAAAPTVSDPSWKRPNWKPRKGPGVEFGGSDGAADAKDAAAAARKAYAARSKYLNDAWRRKAGKPAQGPYFQSADAARVKPSWASGGGGSPPGVGPSGTRSPYRDQRMSDGQKAYVDMCDRLSTAYLKNRRPHVFVPEQGT